MSEHETTVQVTILAAGMGTRLGRPFPKPLTRLADGRSIMTQQLDNVRAAHGRTQYAGSRTILTALIGRQTATWATRDEHVEQEAL